MLADWQLWSDDSNVLSPETCNDIIEEGMKFPGIAAKAGGQVNEKIRNSEVRWLEKEKFGELFDFIERRTHTANRDVYGFDLSYLPDLQFTTYHETFGRGGHYDWHQDVFWKGDPTPKTTHRKLSIIIQLSNPSTYEGGDLELDVYEPPNRWEIRKQGMMIVFPSFHYHKITPVTKGTRHSLVGWYEGPKWR